MKHQILFLLFLCLLGGCKKDRPGDTVDSPILIGEPHEQMNLVMFDNPIRISHDSYYAIHNYKLNVNDDHEDDFLFTSEYSLSPGGTLVYASRIDVLAHNVQIAVTERADSFLLCSVIENDTLKRATFYTPRSGFVCEGNGQSEFKGMISFAYPTIYSKGTGFPSATSWGDSSFYFSSFNLSHFSNPPHVYSVLLGTWNDTHLKYIAFKITINSQTKYGWLLVSLYGHNRIELHGYAIQK